MNLGEASLLLNKISTELKSISGAVEKAANEQVSKDTICIQVEDTYKTEAVKVVKDLAKYIGIEYYCRPEYVKSKIINKISDFDEEVFKGANRIVKNLYCGSGGIVDGLECIENKFILLEDANKKLAKQNDELKEQCRSLKNQKEAIENNLCFYKQLYNECISTLDTICKLVNGDKAYGTASYTNRDQLIIDVHNLVETVKNIEEGE